MGVWGWGAIDQDVVGTPLRFVVFCNSRVTLVTRWLGFQECKKVLQLTFGWHCSDVRCYYLGVCCAPSSVYSVVGKCLVVCVLVAGTCWLYDVL